MKIDLVDYIPTDDFERLERAFHKVFRDAKLTEEDWATVDANQNDLTAIGKSEWFKLDAHQVELFRALAQTVGVSGSTVAMVRQVKRVEGLLEMFERGNKSATDAHVQFVQDFEDWKCDKHIAAEKVAQLQEENAQLRAQLQETREKGVRPDWEH